MSFATIRLETDARGVARLTLARAQKHNALDAAMIAEITAAAGLLAADPAVRVVVLAAEGASFCAGGDLAWMRDQMAADPATRAGAARALALMLRALDRLPQPLIGRVQGQAFGGGVGMMAVCDAAIGVDDARFGLTETRLGLIPATIGPYVLARIGAGPARRLMLSARGFDAAEAVAVGLLARAVPAAELDRALDDEVAPFLQCAPVAVAACKALLRDLSSPLDDAVMDRTIAALTARWDSAEAAEGLAAFFARRKPGWQA